MFYYRVAQKHIIKFCVNALLFSLLLVPAFPQVVCSKNYDINPLFDTEKTTEFISLFYSGTEFHRKGELDLALKEYLMALKIVPSNEMVLICLGRLYRQKDEVDKAIGIFKKVLEKSNDTESIIKARSSLGVLYMDRGEYQKAMDEFKECLLLEPKSKNAVEYRTRINKCKSEIKH